jgi:hypothetical protein
LRHSIFINVATPVGPKSIDDSIDDFPRVLACRSGLLSRQVKRRERSREIWSVADHWFPEFVDHHSRFAENGYFIAIHTTKPCPLRTRNMVHLCRLNNEVSVPLMLATYSLDGF